MIEKLTEHDTDTPIAVRSRQEFDNMSAHPRTTTGDPPDSLNPRDWPKWKKWMAISIVSAQATVSPASSTFLAVGDLAIAADFQTTDAYLPSLPVAFFVLGLGIGPLYLAPCSELYGRRKVYLASTVLFTALNAGSALSPNMTCLVLLRFFCGLAGSAGPGLGAGTVRDVFGPSERSKAQALYGLGPQGGPVIGGVIGGALLQALGWRWLLWIATITSGVTTVATAILLPETYGPYLLKQKPASQRNGERDAVNEGKTEGTAIKPRHVFLKAMKRPLRILVTAPICTIPSLYMSLITGIAFIQRTTLPLLFGPANTYGLFSYNWNETSMGLAYLSGGVGLALATAIMGLLSGRLDRYLIARYGQGRSRPEFRLPLLQAGMVVNIAGLIIHGWTAQARLHWILPLLGQAVFSTGNQMAYVSIQVYLVDVFEAYAASALAGAALARGLVGCLLTVFGFKLYVKLGYGWGSTLLALLCGVSLPLPGFLYFYGPKLREKEVRM